MKWGKLTRPISVILIGDGDADMSTVAHESQLLAMLYRLKSTRTMALTEGNFTRHVLSRDQMAYDTMITDLDGDGDKDMEQGCSRVNNACAITKRGLVRKSKELIYEKSLNDFNMAYQ